MLAYRELVRDLPGWRIPLHEVFFAVDMAFVIGADDPFVAAELDRARGIAERLRSPVLAQHARRGLGRDVQR